jgi:dTDP-4-dehydrorhamnose 3,5-epimerase
MEYFRTDIEDVILFKPSLFGDDRGYFLETYRKAWLEDLGVETEFVQDNKSKSVIGVLRGLHYQVGDFAQDKLVSCVRGSVLDVAVDLRQDSPTFGKYVMHELSDQNHFQMLVPKGFAHGFLCTSEEAIITYKCSHYYNKESERGIIWNDPELNINWPIKSPLLSDKDKTNKKLSEMSKEDLF